MQHLLLRGRCGSVLGSVDKSRHILIVRRGAANACRVRLAAVCAAIHCIVRGRRPIEQQRHQWTPILRRVGATFIGGVPQNGGEPRALRLREARRQRRQLRGQRVELLLLDRYRVCADGWNGTWAGTRVTVGYGFTVKRENLGHLGLDHASGLQRHRGRLQAWWL